MQRPSLLAANAVRLLTVAVPLAVFLFSEMSWTGDGLAVAALLTALGVMVVVGITSAGGQAFRTLAHLDAGAAYCVQPLPRRTAASALKLIGVLLFLATLAMRVTGPEAVAHGDGPRSGLRGYQAILYSLAATTHGLPTMAPPLLAAIFMITAAWVDFRRRDATPDWRRLLLICGWLGLFSIPVLVWMGGWLRVGGWLWSLAALLTVVGAWLERGILPGDAATAPDNAISSDYPDRGQTP